MQMMNDMKRKAVLAAMIIISMGMVHGQMIVDRIVAVGLQSSLDEELVEVLLGGTNTLDHGRVLPGRRHRKRCWHRHLFAIYN